MQGIGEVWEIAPGRGRKPQYDQAARDGIIQATLPSKPKGMTHWSCRLMAEEQEVGKNTVNRLWQLHNLKPHLSRTFHVGTDFFFTNPFRMYTVSSVQSAPSSSLAMEMHLWSHH